MELIKLLNEHGKKLEDVKRIYHGLCNCCRCGCNGKYFDMGSRGFSRALNAIQDPEFKPLAEGTVVWAPARHEHVKSEGAVYVGTCLDIPYDKDTDKCYCLYFED